MSYPSPRRAVVAEGDRVGSHGERDRSSVAEDDDTTGGQAVGASSFMAQARISFSSSIASLSYIVDFVCMKHKLIIEIDGGQHNFDEHAARDRLRDRRLVRDGFNVLRFWNNEVDRNLDGVLTVIDAELRGSTPPGGPSDRHPPPSGEG